MLASSRAGRRARLGAFAAIALAACGGTTAPAPGISMPGAWSVVGYSDHDVVAEAIAGTMTFGADGSYRVQGVIRYPGEPEDSLVASGTYVHDAAGRRLSLTTVDGTTVWAMELAGDTLVLTGTDDPEAPPPSILRLLR